MDAGSCFHNQTMDYYCQSLKTCAACSYVDSCYWSGSACKQGWCHTRNNPEKILIWCNSLLPNQWGVSVEESHGKGDTSQSATFYFLLSACRTVVYRRLASSNSTSCITSSCLPERAWFIRNTEPGRGKNRSCGVALVAAHNSDRSVRYRHFPRLYRQTTWHEKPTNCFPQNFIVTFHLAVHCRGVEWLLAIANILSAHVKQRISPAPCGYSPASHRERIFSPNN